MTIWLGLKAMTSPAVEDHCADPYPVSITDTRNQYRKHPLQRICGLCVRQCNVEPLEPAAFCRDHSAARGDILTRGDGLLWVFLRRGAFRSADGGFKWECDRYWDSYSLNGADGAQVLDGWTVVKWEFFATLAQDLASVGRMVGRWTDDGEHWTEFRVPGDVPVVLYFESRKVGYALVRNYRNDRVRAASRHRDIQPTDPPEVFTPWTVDELLVTRDGGQTWRRWGAPEALRQAVLEKLDCNRPAYRRDAR